MKKQNIIFKLLIVLDINISKSSLYYCLYVRKISTAKLNGTFFTMKDSFIFALY